LLLLLAISRLPSDTHVLFKTMFSLHKIQLTREALCVKTAQILVPDQICGFSDDYRRLHSPERVIIDYEFDTLRVPTV